MATLPPQLEKLISKNHFAYLCTTGKRNQPHVTPIFFVFTISPISIYFLSSSKSRKIVNLISNPRVALSVDSRDPVDPQKNSGVLIRGIAEIVGPMTLIKPNPDWEDRLLMIFKEKYLEFETWRDDYIGKTVRGSIVWVKIRPSTMTWWIHWNFKTMRFHKSARGGSLTSLMI